MIVRHWVFTFGLVIVGLNIGALIDLWMRERDRRAAGVNGEIQLVYGGYRARALGRLVIGVMLMGVSMAISPLLLRAGLVVVGIILTLLSVLDWRRQQRAQAMADRYLKGRTE